MPRMVVVHWTAIPSFDSAFKFFDPPTLDASREDIEDASMLNVAAHYLVKRDGKIYQLLPDTLFARHVIGLNYTAIGIENVGTKDKRLTDAQLKADARLIRNLVKKHDIQYLIGHYEYKQFENTHLWKEQDKNYRTDKIDPGRAYMKRLRERLADLNLKGPPDTLAH